MELIPLPVPEKKEANPLNVEVEIQDSIEAPKPEMTKNYIEKCKPNNILFLVDISSSMRSKDKLDHFKNDLLKIKNLMREEDKISIITFQGEAHIKLKQTPILRDKKWIKVFEKLKGSGGTHFNEGLSFAYSYMKEMLASEYNNRILLISDGEFNISHQSLDLIQESSKNEHIASIPDGSSP